MTSSLEFGKIMIYQCVTRTSAQVKDIYLIKECHIVFDIKFEWIRRDTMQYVSMENFAEECCFIRNHPVELFMHISIVYVGKYNWPQILRTLSFDAGTS